MAYTYELLNLSKQEVRILNVDQSSLDDSSTILQCHIEIHNLESPLGPPLYGAVSYFWGDHSSRGQISIDGKLLSVPVNTIDALRCICLLHRHRKVWIDAVCINQEDLQERTHQVAFMGSVYSKASEVLIWLGDCGGLQPRGRNPLAAVDAAIESLKEILPQAWSPVDAASTTTVQARLPKVAGLRIAWSEIHAVMESEWFSRVWVVQEGLLARKATFFVRDRASPWCNVAAMTTWAFLVRDMVMTTTTPPAEAHRKSPRLWRPFLIPRLSGSDGIDLDTLLGMTHGMECSVPHDRVFAVLGLRFKSTAKLDPRSRIVPDYRQSIYELFARTTKACILDRGSLFPLHDWDVGLRSMGMGPSLPSWMIEAGSFRFHEGLLARECSRAHESTSLRMTDSGNVFSLGLDGVIVDTVTHVVSEEISSKTNVSLKGTVCRGLLSHDVSNVAEAIDFVDSTLACLEKWLPDETPERLKDHMSWVLSRTKDYYRVFGDYSPLNFDRWEKAFHRVLRPDYLTSIAGLERADRLRSIETCGLSDSIKCEKVIICSSLHFSAFTTQHGLFGLGTVAMKAGDRLCIIFGECLPVILRPIQDDWTWIGFAHVRWLSDGSFIRHLRENDVLQLQTTTFIIR